MIILVCVKKANSNSDEELGEVPVVTTSESSEESGTDSTDNLNDPTELIYPEDVVIMEESFTGGGTPLTYTDGDGNTYTKRFFTSFGYSLYIPDGWTKIDHSTSYGQNLYYLISDKEGYEEIEISVATKTGTSGLSAGEVRNLFATTHNQIEYYYYKGQFKYVTSLYTPGTIHQINLSEISGFEGFEDQIVAYYDEPEVTFYLDSNAYYYCNPYVINYYLIKDNVAVMITVIGPRSKGVNMNYLISTMGLNCKELLNSNATAIHYSTDKELSSDIITLECPDDWYAGTSNAIAKRIVCAQQETSYLYGTEIMLANTVIEGENPEDVLLDQDVSETLAKALLKMSPDNNEMTLQNMDYSVSYKPSDISEVNIGSRQYTKIDYTLTVDEMSLYNTFSVIENPTHGTMYITEYGSGYIFVNFQYLSANLTYIDNLADSVLKNIDIS